MPREKRDGACPGSWCPASRNAMTACRSRPRARKTDPEIEVGTRVFRLPPDDFAKRRRRFLVPSGLEERDAEVVPPLHVRGADAQRLPERRHRHAVPVQAEETDPEVVAALRVSRGQRHGFLEPFDRLLVPSEHSEDGPEVVKGPPLAGGELGLLPERRRRFLQIPDLRARPTEPSERLAAPGVRMHGVAKGSCRLPVLPKAAERPPEPRVGSGTRRVEASCVPPRVRRLTVAAEQHRASWRG